MKKIKEYIPIPYCWLKGAVGKDFVIKHYKYGVVKTRFPDMTRIIASARQRKCRDLFKEAVAYAKTVMADPKTVEDWKKKIKRKHRVFNYVIQEFMLAVKENKTKRGQAGARIIRRCFDRSLRNDNIILPMSKTIPSTPTFIPPG